MIKFTLSKSLIYLLIFEIFYYIRYIEVLLLDKFFSFNNSIILTFLMTIGEIIGGLFVYLIINNNFKKEISMNYFGIKLYKKKTNIFFRDGWTKIIILILFASFFDFIEFIILNSFLYKFDKLSSTINQRYSAITTISSSLMWTYALKHKTGKHQTFSIIVISIFLIVQFIIEISYNIEYNKFLLGFVLNILNLILITFTDIIESYLGETNFSNPFGILMGEGIFGFIMTALYSIGKDPFEQIKQNYETFSSIKFILLIVLFILYIILSAILNLYKIHCNIFLSPMARMFVVYVFNPVHIIFSFFYDNDFLYKGEKSISYFILIEIVSFAFTFFGFVYNGYIILYCYNLEYDTIYDIRKRSEVNFKESNTLEFSFTFDSEIEETDNFDDE